uniref:Uncharacterized protein n=1 Tax=Rhizophora mucronata TaxID=61149 RepID=A0A2P2LNE2_RHIMU
MVKLPNSSLGRFSFFFFWFNAQRKLFLQKWVAVCFV